MCRFFSHALSVLSSVCTSNYLRPTFAQKNNNNTFEYEQNVHLRGDYISFFSVA